MKVKLLISGFILFIFSSIISDLILSIFGITEKLTSMPNFILSIFFSIFTSLITLIGVRMILSSISKGSKKNK